MRKEQLTFGHAMIVKAGGMLLHFSIAAVLSRLYGPTVYGKYAYFFSWVTVLALITSLGFDWLFVRETAYLKKHGPLHHISGLVNWGHRLSTIASILVSIIVIGISQWWSTSSLTHEILLFVAVALPLFTWLRLRQGALQGLGFPVASQLPINVILPLLFLSGIIVYRTLRLPASFYDVLGLYLLSLLIVFFSVDIWFRATLRKYPSGRMPLQKNWLYSALRLLLSSGLGLFIYQLPVLLSGLLLGPAIAGVADIVVRGSLIIALPLGAFNLPLAPFVAESSHKLASSIQPTIKRSTRTAFMGAIILSICYIVVAGYALPLFLGSLYRVSLIWLSILVAGQLVNVGVGPVVLILNMQAREAETLKGMLLGLIVIAGSSWLLRSWQLGGILTAYTLGVSVWNVYLFLRVRAILHLDSSILVV